MRDINNSADIIDSRDIIARIDELTSARDAYADNPPDDWEECAQCSGHHPPGYTADCRNDDMRWPADKCVARIWAEANEDDAEELRVLLALQDEASGSPDWPHGEALIRDSYFQDYAQELATDCGMVKDDATWPNNCINWEEAAEQLQQDYTSVDYDGVTYWIRS